MIKKIWQDPVWSKVIAVGIIGFVSVGYAKFISLTKSITFKEAVNEIFNFKIKLTYIIGGLIIYWICLWLYRKLFLNKDNYNKKQKKLREYNKLNDRNAGILYKWEVYFDDETPIIGELKAFCTKHGEPPLRFMDSRCPQRGCVNYNHPIDMYRVENFIESDLINAWEKMKK